MGHLRNRFLQLPIWFLGSVVVGVVIHCLLIRPDISKAIVKEVWPGSAVPGEDMAATTVSLLLWLWCFLTFITFFLGYLYLATLMRVQDANFLEYQSLLVEDGTGSSGSGSTTRLFEEFLRQNRYRLETRLRHSYNIIVCGLLLAAFSSACL